MTDNSNDQYLPPLPDTAFDPAIRQEILEYGRACWQKGREHGRGDTVACLEPELERLLNQNFWDMVIKETK